MRGQLVDVARKVRAAEDRMAEAEGRLETLTAQESALRLSLIARERVTVEVLAAMQRIGRRAPPALLVAPEDVLSSMRAAILLGAVVPELREEALALVKDLKSLVDLRREAADTRARLARERDQIAAERTRLSELIDSRQKQIGLNRNQLEAEKQKVATLSRERGPCGISSCGARTRSSALRRPWNSRAVHRRPHAVRSRWRACRPMRRLAAACSRAGRLPRCAGRWRCRFPAASSASSASLMAWAALNAASPSSRSAMRPWWHLQMRGCISPGPIAAMASWSFSMSAQVTIL